MMSTATDEGVALPQAKTAHLQGTDAALLRRLLVVCLRARWEPDALSEARALAAGTAMDWAELGRIAAAEGVAPLLYHVLRGRGVAPPAVEAELQQTYTACHQRSTVMMAQLEAILRRTNAAGIPVILLKGAALVETVYRRAGLRPMSDLDVLLRQGDVTRAVELLGPLGFAPAGHDPRRGAAYAYENEIILSRAQPPGGLVELHWSLFDSPHHQAHIAMDWFWQTARPCQVGQAIAQVLSPEALLLHLCGHLWLHHRTGTKLLWQHDIVEVIARCGGEINWDTVIERAQRYDLVMPLRKSLLASARDWRAPIPGAVLSGISGLEPAASERNALARLTAAQRSVAGRFWTDLTGLRGWRMRFGYAWGNLFPSAAYMRWRYTIRAPLLVPLYYPYRWLLALHSALTKHRPAA